jgi:hypothetical protein
MFGGGIPKGKYGYADYMRRNLLIKAIVCALFSALFVVLGLIIFKTKRNYLMIPGMLMVLPFANFMASYISWAKFHTAKPEQYAMVKNCEADDMLLCDLAVVNDAGKRMFAEFAVIYRNGVLVYGSDTRWKVQDMDTHFNAKLRSRGLTIRLKSYHDFEEFLARIDGLEPPEDETSKRRVELARDTLINSSM